MSGNILERNPSTVITLDATGLSEEVMNYRDTRDVIRESNHTLVQSAKNHLPEVIICPNIVESIQERILSYLQSK